MPQMTEKQNKVLRQLLELKKIELEEKLKRVMQKKARLTDTVVDYDAMLLLIDKVLARLVLYESKKEND